MYDYKSQSMVSIARYLKKLLQTLDTAGGSAIKI